MCQKITVPIKLAENVKNVPEYAEILCKSVQIFQKGRKSGTLCILRKLWKAIVPHRAHRPQHALFRDLMTAIKLKSKRDCALTAIFR